MSSWQKSGSMKRKEKHKRENESKVARDFMARYSKKDIEFEDTTNTDLTLKEGINREQGETSI